ncbi:MAG: JmjC domain-containing protein [Oxalobacteraceae bacterium]
MKIHSVLGATSVATFLKKYWQKKPLLIPQAFAGMQAPLSREVLFAMVAREDVESRLLTNVNDRWSLKHGPFTELPSTKKKQWTLLVQGLNLHLDTAADLLHQFRFIPDARLDDLMISYATDGGGVGAHFDSYDVFLLQVQGRRRWRISAQKDLQLKAGMPLKLLERFIPEEEYFLEPGDMLYLPPHCAHEGVAMGECMTCSIGFRAPSWQELGQAFLEFKADTLELPGRYADPGLQRSPHPAKLDDALLDRVNRQLQKIRATRDDVTVFLGEYLSEPKPTVMFEPPEKTFTSRQFRTMLRHTALRLHRKTKMLYRERYLFINGDSFRASTADHALLRQLANTRELQPEALARASDDLLDSLHQWHENGWLAIKPG